MSRRQDRLAGAGGPWPRLVFLTMAVALAGGCGGGATRPFSRPVHLQVPTAYSHIQEAVDAATPGDTILVASGLYMEPEDRGFSFRGKDVVVLAENGPGATIIDGRGRDRGIRFEGSETRAAVLDGFTFRNCVADEPGGAIVCAAGASPTIANCRFENNRASAGGALAVFGGGGPRLVSCDFQGNAVDSAGDGGAVRIDSGTAEFEGCSFEGNQAPGGRGGAVALVDGAGTTFRDCPFASNRSAQGGGLYTLGLPLTLDRCTFTGNRSSVGGGALVEKSVDFKASGCEFTLNSAGTGGGVRVDSSEVQMSGCTLEYDSAQVADGVGGGGGVYLRGCSGRITDCEFTGNKMDLSEHGDHLGGGGLYTDASSPAISGCRFLQNDVGLGYGGALLAVDGASPGLDHCLVAENKAGSGGGLAAVSASVTVTASTIAANHTYSFFGSAAFSGGATGTFVRTVFSLNFADFDVYQDSPADNARLECCDGNWLHGTQEVLAAQIGVNGNFNADPLFCDSKSGDYSLRADSPCSPDSTGCGLIGALPVACPAP